MRTGQTARATSLPPTPGAVIAGPTFASRPRGRGPRTVGLGRGLCLATMLTFAITAPARAEPDIPACWTPGEAPDLFAWTDAPGAACRDAARSRPNAPGKSLRLPTETRATAPQNRVGPDTGFTFSAQAYAGIAVAF